MIWRDIAGRYRGSLMGLMWSFLHPLLMLFVYTFVFSVVFKAKWDVGTGESRTVFAIVLFVGLLIHGLLGEVLNRSPNTVISQVNYVKKVVFPLELLPIITLGSALFHLLISVLVLILAMLALSVELHLTMLLFPLVLLPLIPLALGCAWGLAALGVYVRDIGQLMGIITTVLLFLSPIFFPIDTLPPAYHPLIMANPLTLIIGESRAVMLWGQAPDWSALGLYLVGATLFCWAGFVAFQKMRKGFADVL
ncbi:ABC transporter permease [Chromohalobacter israelensis]|uniref:ABC transporter permease n=1 Tax=Chromohalobacter israelensis TaxID=141390 RepID=UPI003D794851